MVVGRIDEQIIFNGHRIELNEIESLSEEIDNINKAIAFVSFSNRLILVYSAIGDIAPNTIIKYLEQRLPRYMVPTKVDQWYSLPINRNGKIDRSAGYFQYVPLPGHQFIQSKQNSRGFLFPWSNF